MADFVFNLSKGRVAEFFNRVLLAWLAEVPQKVGQ